MERHFFIVHLGHRAVMFMCLHAQWQALIPYPPVEAVDYLERRN